MAEGKPVASDPTPLLRRTVRVDRSCRAVLQEGESSPAGCVTFPTIGAADAGECRSLAVLVVLKDPRNPGREFMQINRASSHRDVSPEEPHPRR